MRISRPYRLIIALILCGYLLFALWTQTDGGIRYYIPHIFLPLQDIRTRIFRTLPFSLGDIIYSILFIWLVYSLFRLGKNIWRSRQHGLRKLGPQLFRIGGTLMILYASFILLWGANYKRAPLVPETAPTLSPNVLSQLNDSLIKEINVLASQAQELTLSGLNQQLNIEYKRLFGPKVPELYVKPTLFGSALHYFGIQGYYNPLTGEGQFATSLPNFMWGFVVAHEMAHQAGIAAEGDANFVAYMVCVQDSLPALQYSGCINLFLYANRELAETDTSLSSAKYEALCARAQRDIDTLKQLRSQYKSLFRGLSIDIYHWYLQNRGVKQGIGSYRMVSSKVYEWEQEGKPPIRLYP